MAQKVSQHVACKALHRREEDGRGVNLWNGDKQPRFVASLRMMPKCDVHLDRGQLEELQVPGST